jgi:hypothetical protein
MAAATCLYYSRTSLLLATTLVSDHHYFINLLQATTTYSDAEGADRRWNIAHDIAEVELDRVSATLHATILEVDTRSNFAIASCVRTLRMVGNERSSWTRMAYYSS